MEQNPADFIISQIREAYCRIRKIDHTIPDDILDLMKDAAIEKVAGAEWANEQKEWISVNDTLPPKEYNELSFTKFCIVKSMEGQVTAYYHYRDDQWYTEKEPLNGHRYRPIFNVTHWKNI